MSETADKIREAVYEVYGKGAMADGLIEDLAKRIDACEPVVTEGDALRRSDTIFKTCWNWFSGGSTAELATQDIEESLL